MCVRARCDPNLSTRPHESWIFRIDRSKTCELGKTKKNHISQKVEQGVPFTYWHEDAFDLPENLVQMGDAAQHQGDDHRVHRAVGHRGHPLAALRHEPDGRVQVGGLLPTLAPEVHLERRVRVDAVQTRADRVKLQIGAGANADLMWGTEGGREGEKKKSDIKHQIILRQHFH